MVPCDENARLKPLADSDSPYAPPRSAVADAAPREPQPGRPARMTPALIALGLDYTISLVAGLGSLLLTPLDGGVLVASAATMVVILGLFLWIILGLARGRNWARLAFFGYTGLSLLGTMLNCLRYARGSESLFAPLLSVASLGLELYVMAILLTAPVRDWFHAMREHK